jgi:hypothetical protein
MDVGGGFALADGGWVKALAGMDPHRVPHRPGAHQPRRGASRDRRVGRALQHPMPHTKDLGMAILAQRFWQQLARSPRCERRRAAPPPIGPTRPRSPAALPTSASSGSARGRRGSSIVASPPMDTADHPDEVAKLNRLRGSSSVRGELAFRAQPPILNAIRVLRRRPQRCILAVMTRAPASPRTPRDFKSTGAAIASIIILVFVVAWSAVVLAKLDTAPTVGTDGKTVLYDTFGRAKDIFVLVLPLLTTAAGFWLGSVGTANAKAEAGRGLVRTPLGTVRWP